MPTGQVCVSEANDRGMSGTIRQSAGRATEVSTSSVVLLPWAPSSVATARWQLAADLREAGLVAATIGDAALVLSELLSNAIRHARPLPGAQVQVAWSLCDGSLTVSVRDGGGPTRPHAGHPSPSALGGRGLAIVECLASTWGVQDSTGGVTVWAVLPARPYRGPGTANGHSRAAGLGPPGVLGGRFRACRVDLRPRSRLNGLWERCSRRNPLANGDTPCDGFRRRARHRERGMVVGHTHGVDSEVGHLRTVLAHRPGAELLRITPRTRDHLLFPGQPWVARAQQEHDIAAQCLRDHGAEVLYVMELLQDVMEYPSARAEVIVAALGAPWLGERLRADLGSHLAGLDPEDLAHVLVAGLTAAEFRPGRGVVFGLMDRHDFVIPPLPNLLFLRDSHLWIGPAVAAASMAPPRRREAALVRSLYQHHPRFAGVACVYGPEQEPLDAGDLLQLAPGVIAAGIGQRTTAGRGAPGQPSVRGGPGEHRAGRAAAPASRRDPAGHGLHGDRPRYRADVPRARLRPPGTRHHLRGRRAAAVPADAVPGIGGAGDGR